MVYTKKAQALVDKIAALPKNEQLIVKAALEASIKEEPTGREGESSEVRSGAEGPRSTERNSTVTRGDDKIEVSSGLGCQSGDYTTTLHRRVV